MRAAWSMVVILVLLVGASAASACGAPVLPVALPIAAPPFVMDPATCERMGAEVLDHDVALSIRLAPPSLTGQGTLRVRARHGGKVLALDAHQLLVASVSAHGVPLRFQHDGDQLCIELQQPLEAQHELDVQLAWSVTAPASPLEFTPDQAWAGYRASAWMPTRQDAAQRATLHLQLTVPSSLNAVASGRALGRVRLPNGLVTHAFVVDRPSPPFLYAFAIGTFDEAELSVDGTTLRALGPPGSDLRSALATTAPMLRFFVERFGAPPSSEYLEVFVHGDAAQEAAGLSLLADSALDDLRKDPTDDWLLSHELAHQWFGWLVPCVDFSDFWLNEGFATFMVAAFKEQRWGRSAYDAELAVWRRRSAKVHAEGRDAPLSLSRPGAPERPSPPDSALPPRGVTYFRGALVLDRLRSELGDDAFWKGLRRYVTDRAGRGARTEDLRASLEQATGHDLRAFFERWVHASAPDL